MARIKMCQNQLALTLLLLGPSIALGQESEPPPKTEATPAKEEVAAEAEKFEFRWLERAHTEGLTDSKKHDTICPDCSANHVGFAHKTPVDLARHITRIERRKGWGTRSCLHLEMTDEGIQTLNRSTAEVTSSSLGLFVGGEFVGAVATNDKSRTGRLVKFPSADHVQRFYRASNAPKLKAPELLARFRFDGDVKDSSGQNVKAIVKNPLFREGSLYVNGKYAGNPDDAKRALTCKIPTPKMTLNRFTVALRFKAYRLQDPEYRTILCAGSDTCWFRLFNSQTGHLAVSLRKGRFTHLTEFKVKTKQWHTVVCQFDTGARILVLHVNGKELDPVRLSSEGIEAINSEQVWSFASKANGGSVLHGLVDELAVFDGAFWPGQIPSTILSPMKPTDEPHQDN